MPEFHCTSCLQTKHVYLFRNINITPNICLSCESYTYECHDCKRIFTANGNADKALQLLRNHSYLHQENIATDIISLNELKFDVIVGICEFERDTNQTMIINLNMEVSQENIDTCATTGLFQYTINYAAIGNQLQFLAQYCRFGLLESYGAAICRLLLLPPTSLETRAQIISVSLSIEKPNVLDSKAIPGLTIRRDMKYTLMKDNEAAENNNKVIKMFEKRLNLPVNQISKQTKPINKKSGKSNNKDRNNKIITVNGNAKKGHWVILVESPMGSAYRLYLYAGQSIELPKQDYSALMTIAGSGSMTTGSGGSGSVITSIDNVADSPVDLEIDKIIKVDDGNITIKASKNEDLMILIAKSQSATVYTKDFKLNNV